MLTALTFAVTMEAHQDLQAMAAANVFALMVSLAHSVNLVCIIQLLNKYPTVVNPQPGHVT